MQTMTTTVNKGGRESCPPGRCQTGAKRTHTSSARAREQTVTPGTMGGAVPPQRPPTETATDRSSFAERNERVRVERLRSDAKRPRGELLGETLRLAKFLTGLADSAQRDGEVRP